MTAPVYATPDIEGIGGVIRERIEDFLVEEVPLYNPSGDGEHIYLMIEKRGRTTLDVARMLAKHFGVRRDAVGFAGLKDKRAITRQVFSVHTPGKALESFAHFEHPDLSVLWVDRHTNKLRRGHLRGNRFSIRVRGVDAMAVVRAQRGLAVLERTGVPDRFGAQRFGILGNNDEIGLAILTGRAEDAVRLMLARHPGSPTRHDDARRAFEEGDVRAALDGFPKALRAERQVLRALADGASPTDALARVEKIAIEFYLSGLQSRLFNHVVDQRTRDGTLGELAVGDLAFVHEHRAVFAVTQDELDKPDTADRVRTLALSATGPMWGASMQRAGGATDRAELEALATVGLTPETLVEFETSLKRGSLEGTRRPLRVPILDTAVEGGVDDHGSYVRCGFELPRGAFATTVLGEIMKPDGDPSIGATTTDDRSGDGDPG